MNARAVLPPLSGRLLRICQSNPWPQSMYELGIEPAFWEAPAGEDISATVSPSVEPTLTPLMPRTRMRHENVAFCILLNIAQLNER